MPRVILEAMASELPVIATRIRGSRELITPELGFLYEPRNVDALGRLLAQVYRMAPDARRRLGQAGRRRVLEAFTEEGYVARQVQDLARFIHSSRRESLRTRLIGMFAPERSL
jgi:glycosyltransferase involved in cell wall biosynthesis